MNAIEAVKKELKNSKNIEKTTTGYNVWDEDGMDIAFNVETIEEAVDILFIHIYAI